MNMKRDMCRMIHDRNRAVRVGSCRGVALIITLIMLAVITFMATTFLVLSRRARNSVSRTTDQTTARFAADNALERAKAELLASIMSTTNDQNYGLMVPTNYYNVYGFQSGISSFTNVNYAYGNGSPLTVSDFLINLTNLLYNPRPPVFVTNRLTGGLDFRFYLDLNRNGVFDPSGVIAETNSLGQPVVTGQNNTNYVSVVGDPQWVGELQYPDRHHSSDNKFLSRWTYLVVPDGQTLDANTIHNQALTRTVNPVTGTSPLDGYARNEGVGPWEMNLAAFLADLNTNIWNTTANPYNYRATLPPAGSLYNTGFAFDDARAFISYRYGYNYLNQLPASGQFPAGGGLASLRTNNIDIFSDGFSSGRFMYGTVLPAATQVPTRSWAGSDNTNHYYTTQDFFDPTKTSAGFTNRLILASQQKDTYDRYTFYRMISQLGADSAPVDNKINVNYKNMVNGAVVPGMETNLISWQPLDFFTNAAAMMFQHLNLRDNFGNLITVTNIPIYPYNYYTPAVHRVLQLAANIYDASVNGMYPSIFRPFFTLKTAPIPNGTTNGTYYSISGYELVNAPNDTATLSTFLTYPNDINLAPTRSLITTAPTHINLYGVPWVIGAKKGFPNFNQVQMQTVSQISRKLKLQRPSTSATLSQYQMSQMYLVGVSNAIGVSLWNSYSNNYVSPRGASSIYIQADGNLTMSLVDSSSPSYANNPYTTYPLAMPIGAAAGGGGITNLASSQPWQGTRWFSTPAHNPPNVNSFMVPLFTNYVFLPDAAYVQGATPTYIPAPTNVAALWPNAPGYFPQPQWNLYVTNNIRCFISDGGAPPAGRIIDYVQLGGMSASRPLTAELQGEYNLNKNALGGIWNTNVVRYLGAMLPYGLGQQLDISQGNIPAANSDSVWANNMISAPQANTRLQAIDFFRVFMGDSPIYFPNTVVTDLVAQAPFTPTGKFYQQLSWQANDPLVHYLASDLTPVATNSIPNIPPGPGVPTVYTNLTALTLRYSPWGGRPVADTSGGGDTNAFSVAVKDPMMYTSDNWDFPTNKLPNVGWLGRVHRGTPWQTVYLKAADVSPGTAWAGWRNWSSDNLIWASGILPGRINYTNIPVQPIISVSNNPFFYYATNIVADAAFHRPVTDRILFDVFTSSLNENASRGLLSINQTNLAAWSAVLSGVIALTNAPPTNVWTIIQPAGTNNYSLPIYEQLPVAQIWQGINQTRANQYALGTTFTNNVFHSLGDMLATPQLTYYDDNSGDHSPFLNVAGHSVANHDFSAPISDEVMERIPQQIMGLVNLSHSPRFVIYAYGQTLHPAPSSIYFGNSAFSGLCTNYQVTAETAVRAVVRVDGTPDPAYANAPDIFGNKYPPHIVVEQFNVLPPD